MIYKFRPIDKNLLVCLLDNYIYAANPVHFNDPFEGIHDVDYVSRVVADTIIGGMADGGSLKGLDIQQIKHVKDDLIQRLFDFIASKHIEYLTKLNVACFSGNYKDILLWSHYADWHRGVCLEIDESQFGDKMLSVVYDKNISQIKFEENGFVESKSLLH